MSVRLSLFLSLCLSVSVLSVLSALSAFSVCFVLVSWLVHASGVRAVVVNPDGEVQFDSALRWAAPDDPDEWLRAADTLMGDVPLALRK